ncbi:MULTISPECIES: GNAT family N-acetyltransferase [unclassified Streptomyces]|uniref:GNAT family N-acetyltransferase n=1 Tax=unclassified Streptomyces TaxID=2593676 RepID=UPI0036E97D73
MVLELTRSWVAGLALARRSPVPVELPWGMRVDVARPRERARYVLLRSDEDTLRDVAAQAAEPTSRILTFLDPGRASAVLGPVWQRRDAELLMTAPLRRTAARVPDGYETDVETDGSVTRVRVHTADGETAAAGYAAVHGAVAVVDRVATYPAHQRRGLGTLVMHALTEAALASGARSAVLSATEEGRALYTFLGWVPRASLAVFVRLPQ